MAHSTCPKPNCGSTRFETKKFEPTDAIYTLLAHQCAVCGTVVGVTQYHDTGTLLKQLGAALKQVGDKAEHIKSRVDWLIANKK